MNIYSTFIVFCIEMPAIKQPKKAASGLGLPCLHMCIKLVCNLQSVTNGKKHKYLLDIIENSFVETMLLQVAKILRL